MATDSLSSMLSQQRKAMDALAIETQQKFAALQKNLEEEAIVTTQKRVKQEISQFEKMVDRLLDTTRKRIEQELAKQVAQSLIGSSTGTGGASQGQLVGQLSTLLSTAARNL